MEPASAGSVASGLAVRANLRTRPRTAFAITPAITFATGWQQTVRLNPQTGPHLAFRVDRQVPVSLASSIGRGTGAEIVCSLPVRVSRDTAMGAVPGTVPGVVRGVSVQGTRIAAKAIFFSHLAGHHPA